jgi:hypothetical protein
MVLSMELEHLMVLQDQHLLHPQVKLKLLHLAIHQQL